MTTITSPVSRRSTYVGLENIIFNIELNLTGNGNNCHAILFFRQGAGIHTIGANQYPVNPYTIHLVSNEQKHSIEKSAPVSGYCLLVPDIDFCNYLPQHFLDMLAFGGPLNSMPVVKPDEDDFKIISGILLNVRENCSPSLFKHSPDIAGNYLNVLFSYIYLCYLKKCSSSDSHLNKLNRIIRNYILLVEQHFAKHYSVQQYAEILCTAPNYLNELCKKELGITAQLVVKNKLIAGAKQMLLHTDKGIKEISYELGFCNPSHFTLFFRKHTSFSPSAYQKTVL